MRWKADAETSGQREVEDFQRGETSNTRREMKGRHDKSDRANYKGNSDVE